MINIEEALDKIFTYPRKENALIRRMNEQSLAVKNEFNNIEIIRKDIGFCGNIHFLADFGRDGRVLAHYTAAAELSREVPGAAKLSEDLLGLADTAFNHMGVLMNCLAYMYGKNIGRLILVQPYTSETHVVRIKPILAEVFMAHVNKNFKRTMSVAEDRPAAKRVSRKNFVDPKQSKLFS